ncbi:MAG: putative dienelactone hydrolase [Paracoccaceae bacterium]|jgi:predicted dienelactone hydrolase
MTPFTLLARAGATAVALSLALPAMAQNRIDLVRPDAPTLAIHGAYKVGVRTMELSNPGQLNILGVKDGARPTYDRPLTVEIWHPATTDQTGGTYDTLLRDGETHVTITGAAVRDAAPDMTGAPYPLVIISHGYPGNRILMAHLGESLAARGYVAVSIDHTDSLYQDMGNFGSTLVNRPIDQMFVLEQMAQAGAAGGALAGVVDASKTGLIGYSMGGYGAVISAGGGISQAGVDLAWGAPEGLAAVNRAGSDTHEALIDDRLAAVIAIGPWGMELGHYGGTQGFWDAEGLAGVRKPILFMAGTSDATSIYETGVKAIYEGSINAPWRGLLSFANAGHNAVAPMPAPMESWAMSEKLGWAPFEHYADAVWDTTRMNNIAQHFAAAFMDLHLKGDAEMATYLDLAEDGGAAVFAAEKDGTLKPEHTYWKGFKKGTAAGLSFSSAVK